MVNSKQEFKKYSIWLLTDTQIEKELQNSISLLSHVHGSQIFRPHLTILGEIKEDKHKMINILNDTAYEFHNLNLTLGEISFSTTFFQSVFVRVNSTAKLMSLNLRLKQLFNVENDVYMPHISLLYGNHDMQTREEAAKNVKLLSTNYRVDRVALVPSTDDPAEWMILHQIELHN